MFKLIRPVRGKLLDKRRSIITSNEIKQFKQQARDTKISLNCGNISCLDIFKISKIGFEQMKKDGFTLTKNRQINI